MNSDSSNSISPKTSNKIGRPLKYSTDEERKMARYKCINECHKKSGYTQSENYKERQKLMQKRYRLQERITKFEHGLYKMPRYSVDVDSLKNEMFQITQLLSAK